MTKEEAMTAASLARAGSARDWITGLNHIALHVRDLAEATRFWTGLFEAEPFGKATATRPAFHFRLPGGVVLALFERPGAVNWDMEYPHYGFEVTPEGLRAMKQRLDEAGVATHRPWTRNRKEALMYFRDPSGNMFELYCPHYDRIDELALSTVYGGDFEPSLADLRYDWRG